MAEVVSLVSFDLDTKKLESSLSTLQDRYIDLKKEQEDYAKQTKLAKSQIDLLVKSQTALTASAGDNSEAIDKNAKEIEDLTKKERELTKAQINASNQMSVVKKEINQTTTQLNAYQNAEAKTTSLINLGNAAIDRQINNKNEARAANIELNKVSNQLNPAIEEEAELLKRVNQQIDDNTKFIKANTSEVGKAKMSIGEYANGIKDALSQLNPFNGGLMDFISNSKEAGGAGNLLKGAFSGITTGLLGMTKAAIAFIFTGIGAVIVGLAVAVGAVVGAFKLATASLKSTEEGSDRLAVVTGAVTGVFKGLFKIIRPFGEFLADVFIKHLENVGKAAMAMAGFLADALDFLGFDESAKGVRDFTNEVIQSSNAAAKLADSENKLNKSLRESEGRILKIQRAAEILRQQRDDESKSISQRIAANTQLGKTLQVQSDYEKSLAKQALANANLRIVAEGGIKKASTESLAARAEALNKIEEINERISGQESEQLANLNSLRKEASDAEKERQEKATERALALSKARIEAFIAEQGFKRKSAEDEYNFNYELYNKEYADLKLQLQKKKITQAEFDAQMNQLRVDYLAKNAALAIENAELELQIELDKNARILDSDKYLSKEQLRIKQQALADDLKAQLAFEAIRLKNGDITQKQYNANINAINAENKSANDALIAEQKVAEQEKALIDLENQKIINEENFLAQAEIEKQQNEIKRQQEIANAEQTGADISLINARYAKMQEDIERAKQDNKVKLASDAFGTLASIFGAESKAGKASAIAQTTIDTYQSAISAFKSLSGIPIVGPVLGGIAAAAAVASGLKAVKQITATKTPTVSKTPSYATGVIGLRGAGSGTSDNISANLSAGESVINARSTSMFANELSAINQAGGGVGINGASNILNQNEVQNNANNSQMAQMIAEAVAIGAEAGTSKGAQSGITNLSDNRRIMDNAKF